MTGSAARTVAALVAGHRSGEIVPGETVARTYARIREVDDPAIFITLREEAAVQAEARALPAGTDAALPLHGVPVAIKDNIDVAGLPTTAGCPAYATTPSRDATAVARLKAAGALIIGKTNLDQFATGLVGMRSPYGMPRNPLRGDLVCGGSSSGSAVAVATGIVPLALGTDTAGSGRVPAALNNIVGLKPSLGLVSTAGVVPACASLDCVSVFALTAEDAFAALQVIAGLDASDPYSAHLALGVLARAAAPAAHRRAALRRIASFTATRGRRRRSMPRSGLPSAWAPAWSRSTSRRSSRRPSCSTRVRGWPSARPRSAISSHGTQARCTPSRARS